MVVCFYTIDIYQTVLLQSYRPEGEPKSTSNENSRDVYKTWTTPVDRSMDHLIGPRPWTSSWTTPHFKRQRTQNGGR